jgi:hypothetical protein
MPAGYVVETTADVALTAATKKTILSVIAAANALIRLVEFGVSFDGISATAESVTVELEGSTQAGAGTSTSQSPVQTRGPTRTVQASGARNFTAQPSALTVWRRWLVHPQTGIEMQYPLGREPEQITTADAIVLSCTAPATVNAQGYMEFEEG